MSDAILIRAAAAGDLPAMESLLRAAALPLAGLAAHLDAALVAEAVGVVAGCVAIEVYGEHGLLRSLVVDGERRAHGLGGRLVDTAFALAHRRAVERLWLLTTTAEPFFRRRGFDTVARAALPAALGASAELRGACPATAIAMTRAVD